MPLRVRKTDSVFINCPFDAAYYPFFEVIVFTIYACGFLPRSALEESDSGDVRIDKILRLLNECRYAVHDISSVGLDADHQLPRFNMPFELGLDIGCKRFGGKEAAKKRILILDSERFRYQIFLSDIAGQDIRAHGKDLNTAIKIVRDWLRTTSQRKNIPGDDLIRQDFGAFAKALPAMCSAGRLNRNALTYSDYVAFVEDWLSAATKVEP